MTLAPHADVRSLTTLLRLAIGRELMDVHTALPGEVEEYDATTRRARVVPAVPLLLDDGSAMERPPVVDVPVIFPSGGGLSLLFPLSHGEPVLLIFSQRGLDSWKIGYRRGPPSRGPIFDLSDAMALAGFGALTTAPVSATGAALQTDDGAASVVVEPSGEVNIVAAGPVTVRATQINLLTA